ncbi:hypothetical protein Hypma_005951 [Hypsizygus marmoreus]|uniref:Uncharacterized protein n=1 Tax=Hypsizygus marmoreus TaxID=39966 RepID=A0A369KGH8_HYPMA|nr:hypothetical protein Hypma_005951 [Hypsizygus marmoreus]
MVTRQLPCPELAAITAPVTDSDHIQKPVLCRDRMLTVIRPEKLRNATDLHKEVLVVKYSNGDAIAWTVVTPARSLASITDGIDACLSCLQLVSPILVTDWYPRCHLVGAQTLPGPSRP